MRKPILRDPKPADARPSLPAAMTENALTEWKRMKAIELRLRTTTRSGEVTRLHTELYEATTAFASAFSANLPRSPVPAA